MGLRIDQQRMPGNPRDRVAGDHEICHGCVAQVKHNSLSCTCNCWTDSKFRCSNLARVADHLPRHNSTARQRGRDIRSNQIITEH